MSSSGQSASKELWRLISGSAFIFACRVSGAVLTFASQVLLARWMGAAELGAYVIAFSWCILLSTVATAGLPSAAIRFIGVALANRDYATVIGFHRRSRVIVLGLGLAIAIVGTLTVMLAGTAIPGAYRMPMLLGLAAVPLFALLILSGGVANSFSWLGQSFLPGNVFRPLLFLGAVALVGWKQGRLDATTAMQVQWILLVVIAAAAALRLEQRIGRVVEPVAPRYETRRWMRTAMPLLGVMVFTSYLAEITVVLVGMQLPSHEVAIFQVSYRIALLIAFGLNAVDAFAAPEAARLIATTDRDSLQRMVNRATRLRFWPALAAVGVLAAVGEPLLGLFGPEFRAGYVVLVILAAAQLPLAAVGPVMRLLSVSGHEDRCLHASLGSLAVLVPLVAVLVPAFGTTGAALAALLDMALWSLWMYWLVVQYLDIRPSFLATRGRTVARDPDANSGDSSPPQASPAAAVAPLATGEKWRIPPQDAHATPAVVHCGPVTARNWSRVAPGELRIGNEPRGARPVYLKQYLDADGHPNQVNWADEQAGCKVAAAIIGHLVQIPATLAHDGQRLVNVFELQPVVTVDELLRQDRTTLLQRFDELMRRMVAVLDALESAGKGQIGGTLPLKRRPYDSGRRAVNFQGLDIRNVGYATDGRAALVMFDFGKPYLSNVEEAAAKLFVSVGLLNWGKPMRLFLRGPDTELLEKAIAHLAPYLTPEAVEATIEAEAQMRRNEPKARSPLVRTLKRIGIQTIGRLYFSQFSRWVRTTGMAASARPPGAP